jgi:hypothetical protein
MRIASRLALSLGILLGLAVAGVAPVSAEDTLVYVKDQFGSPRFVEIKTFGNRRRIEKLIDPSTAQDVRVYQKDLACQPQFVLLPEVGNQNRIAARVDPSVRDNTDAVVYLKNPEGRMNLSRMKTFGNSKRIQRLTGIER